MAIDASRNAHVTSILLAAIVLGALVNIAQFGAINARAPKNYRAFVRYSNADLIHIGTREAPLFHRRHGRALAFAKAVNPGARLVFPANRQLVDDELVQQLLSFGQAASVRRVAYDPDKLGKRIDRTKHVIAKVGASKRQRRGFILISRGSDAREFAFMRRGKTDVLIDVTLLSKRVRQSLAS